MKIIYIGGAKAAEAVFCGEEYYLLLNGAAMFALQEEFGSVSKFYEAAKEQTREGVEAMAKGFAILAEQGEAARKLIGLKAHETPTAEMINVTAPPGELPAMLSACVDAINMGYGREVKEEDEEIDLGLAELQKKKADR